MMLSVVIVQSAQPTRPTYRQSTIHEMNANAIKANAKGLFNLVTHFSLPFFFYAFIKFGFSMNIAVLFLISLFCTISAWHNKWRQLRLGTLILVPFGSRLCTCISWQPFVGVGEGDAVADVPINLMLFLLLLFLHCYCCSLFVKLLIILIGCMHISYV